MMHLLLEDLVPGGRPLPLVTNMLLAQIYPFNNPLSMNPFFLSRRLEPWDLTMEDAMEPWKWHIPLASQPQ